MHATSVFFPDYVVSARSGLCIGWMDHRARTICVLAVVHLPFDPHAIMKQLQMTTSVRRQPLTILGPITHQGDPDRGKILRLCGHTSQGFCMELTRPDAYSLPTCTLFRDGQPTMGDYHFVLYNQSQILKCCLPRDNDAADKQSVSKTAISRPSASACGDDRGEEEKDRGTVITVETLLSTIQEGTRQLSTLNDWNVSIDAKMQRDKAAIIQRYFKSLVLMLVSTVNFFLMPFRSGLWNRLSQNAIVQSALRLTQTGCQIQVKYKHLRGLLDTYSQATHGRRGFTEEAKIKTTSKHRYKELRTGNLWTYLLVDTMMGVLLMWWIHHSNWPGVWATWTISSANTTAGSLQMLLQWLMGAPAGLKLNSALAHFLGQFFLYHVYLWMGYLSIIQPALGWAIWCMSLTGCLGVSVILAVASDMVSMLTFHIYCFYVYAARIYSLQLTGLLALARLFRGKKWNVLRKRVDTCHYDVDQLFIGTLLFTILLFLLPTTILFYVVFTLLRLAVILLKAVLTKTTDLLERLPAYSVLLCLSGSDVPMSDVSFALVQQPGEGHSNTLVMQVQHMGIYDVLLLAYEGFERSSTRPQSSGSRNPILSLVMDLITGQLIYPWGLVQMKTL